MGVDVDVQLGLSHAIVELNKSAPVAAADVTPVIGDGFPEGKPP